MTNPKRCAPIQENLTPTCDSLQNTPNSAASFMCAQADLAAQMEGNLESTERVPTEREYEKMHLYAEIVKDQACDLLRAVIEKQETQRGVLLQKIQHAFFLLDRFQQRYQKAPKNGREEVVTSFVEDFNRFVQ